MSHDILLEIGTEEMPAKFMPAIVDGLKDLASSGLKENRIGYGSLSVYATPRRMALLVRQADDRQTDEQVKKRGPSVQAAFDSEGNPTKAAQGFARGQQVNPGSLKTEDGYVWAEKTVEGKQTKEVLPQLFQDLIQAMSFPKSMRWGTEETRFVRPIRWIVALCDKEVIPFRIAGVDSGCLSRGHRFLCPGEVRVPSAGEYLAVMDKAFVMADQNVRRETIRRGLVELADNIHGVVKHDAGLLEEITYLVEYPTPLCGHIDGHFLELPEPAVITPMKDHQRYYPVRDRNGQLMPLFLTVRNGGRQSLHTVQVGNERVLRARLDDAEFFFKEDRKKTLAQRRDDLKRINYQEGLGSLLDKANRLEALVEIIGEDWNFSEKEKENARRAAYLSKSDLATGMVTEFTELQGEMGKEYALLDGESPETAQAVFEQYMPRFAGDRLPEQPIGRALSIADKLDNIAATFSRGLVPTGSQDPFALRRQAIGIINMIDDGKIHWSLRKGLSAAIKLLHINTNESEQILSQADDFFRQRIKTILQDRKVPYDIIDAVTGEPVDDIEAVFLRADSMVGCHIHEEEGLRQMMTRLAHMAGNIPDHDVKETLFQTEEERELWKAYSAAAPDISKAYQLYQYEDALPALRSLTDPANHFLDGVMVMVEDSDVRANRLALLHKILQLASPWGDFEKLS